MYDEATILAAYAALRAVGDDEGCARLRALALGTREFADRPPGFLGRVAPGLARAVQARRAKSLADALVERWGGFTPTLTVVSPSRELLSKRDEYWRWAGRLESVHPIPDEGGHYGDMHDLAAVVAGRKPAALVDPDFVRNHPVGQELARRAVAAGHVVHFATAAWGADNAVVGRPDSAERVRRGLEAGSRAEIGHGLGYPAEAVKSHMEKA